MKQLKNFKTWIANKYRQYIIKQYKKLQRKEVFVIQSNKYSVKKGRKKRCFSYVVFENQFGAVQIWFKHKDITTDIIVNQFSK